MMMNFKTTVMAAVFATTMTTAVTPAMAADPSMLTFDLAATIPVERYYVVFSDPSFSGTTHTMPWNNYTETLENVSTYLKAKNTAGKITAHLSAAPQLVHTTDPLKIIPLDIQINSVTLPVGSGTPAEILAAAVTTEQTLPLVVSPGTVSAYDAGAYEGTINMVFDYEI
ncbi:CS1 type fimbrial major subunit [Scandinavium sp. UTDF21-P1B]|uniref:CS1 type fimbrial major subunit n=1 Tax=Scandinavium sp. UTDF21-P1B TaxID=3446379 RepID=UPI003F49C3F6